MTGEEPALRAGGRWVFPSSHTGTCGASADSPAGGSWGCSNKEETNTPAAALTAGCQHVVDQSGHVVGRHLIPTKVPECRPSRVQPCVVAAEGVAAAVACMRSQADEGRQLLGCQLLPAAQCVRGTAVRPAQNIANACSAALKPQVKALPGAHSLTQPHIVACIRQYETKALVRRIQHPGSGAVEYSVQQQDWWATGAGASDAIAAPANGAPAAASAAAAGAGAITTAAGATGAGTGAGNSVHAENVAVCRCHVVLFQREASTHHQVCSLRRGSGVQLCWEHAQQVVWKGSGQGAAGLQRCGTRQSAAIG